MNSYAAIILAALLVEYVLSIVANILNIRALQSELPVEFDGLYDQDAYRRSQEYTRVRTWFKLVTATFDLGVVLLFWFSGGFELVDRMVRGWELGPVWGGVAYIGLLMLARMILSLPFSLYSTSVIESRFGFNKTTPATFIADLAKGLLLAIVLGVPVLAGILALFEYAGTAAWLYGWLAATLYILILQFVMPTWIMPLFNRFTPLDNEELGASIREYARSVGFSLANIFVIDGSRRSARSNAFFAGLGRNRRIALYDTLIAQHSTPELVAVVAHEVGHYKRKHVVKGMIVSVLHMGAVFYLLSIFASEPRLFQAFGVSNVSVYAGLVFFMMLLSPIELLLSVVMQAVSRKHEFEADSYAAETTRTPGAMIDALKKLSLTNLSNLTPHPLFVFLYYSHPPVLERIRAIRSTAH